MSDVYEFDKANKPQETNDYSPYTDKQYNSYINDINNGVYSNNSLSLINYDLGQIFNSSKYTNPGDLFVVLPIMITAGYSAANTILAPLPGSSNLCSIKSNFVNLIHQCDMTLNGKSIGSGTQPFTNVAQHFKMISEMTENDLKTMGSTLGFSPCLDSVKSMRYSANIAAGVGNVGVSGNGLSNNRIFGSPGVPNALTTSQNSGVANAALAHKVGRYVDTMNNSNNVAGLATVQQLQNEFKPYYEVKNNYMIWYDYCVIKLEHLFESLGHIGLVKRLDCTIRLYVNTGSVNIKVGTPTSNDINYLYLQGNSTFSNTCPLMINHIGFLNSTTGIPATCTDIVASLTIARPITTSSFGINLANSQAIHPLGNSRIYYSSITLDPNKDTIYAAENLNKKVVFRSFVSNQYNNIPAAGTFNALVNSGVVHPTGVLICPFPAANATSGFTEAEWKSPFSSSPATISPCGLTNLQVNVGGQNILQSTLFYNYENFIEQVNLAEQLSSSDFGISTGLIDQNYWESSKWYFVNVERSEKADKLNPRNINVSFNNNSNVPIDVLIFTFYSDEFTINCTTGVVEK